MGFDVYGLDPVKHKTIDEYPVLKKYQGMTWEERGKDFNKDKKLESKYWEEYEAEQDDNPGSYFRSNVWWWRTMWMYVYFNSEDILTEEDYENCQHNSGHEISEEKATALAKRMLEHIESGEAKGFEEHHKKEMSDAKMNNEKIKAETGESYGDNWDWRGDYPFDVNQLREFAEFCSQSGGFRVC